VYPLWDDIIAPVIRAAGAERVVEIGALRGETTVQLLDELGPNAEAHVIDPEPEFDPTEHEKRFPGRYIFYRDLSHNVLPQLPPVDVALIDGDHNWYTVYHELRMLRETATNAGAPLPVLILHDVGWPYGRRDLYYAPEQVPEEFRQPYAQGGIRPERSQLMPIGRGGLNPTMHNAVEEGGPRNGVMTALDDFIAELDDPVQRLFLPIYFGLAIVVEESRLERQPELAAVLDDLQTAEGRHRLLELAERLRLKAQIFQHTMFYKQQERLDRGATRYLDLLKAALLNEHYLENEVRISYLLERAEGGQRADLPKVHDPERHLRNMVNSRRQERRAGLPSPGPDAAFAYTTIGRARLDNLQTCLDTIREHLVDGDLVECGTGRGGGAIFLRGYLEAHEMIGRKVWVADTFRGPEGPAGPAGDRPPSQQAHLNIVRNGFDRFGLLDQRVRFLQGEPADTLPDAPIEKVALLRVDSPEQDRVQSTLECLYDKLTLGGFVVIDNYRAEGCRKAVETFRADRGIGEPIERVDWSAAYWRKLATPAGEAPAPHRAEGTATVANRAPLAPPVPALKACDLSVIVVCYNVRREAERTLHSLSRAYQRGVDDLDYEVIAVENGSAPDQSLSEDYVRSFGPEFRYLDLADEATPSPAAALNRGVEVARGEAIALMIDGAHVLTPSVLRYGMTGLRQHDPAMVVTQQWYIGPGQQPEAVAAGYDQDDEDHLFEAIGWPADGYRLFDIGHFIGDRDWFDGLWESNCVFVPRKVLQQVGSMDESFSMPGGGYANLDFYERIGSTPGLDVVTILGEGSFHQVHGGTTTNQTDVDERNHRLISYRDHYAALRGRGFRGHGKPIHYVGSMVDSARRTRTRRVTAPHFWRSAQRTGPDGRPTKPVPIPEELADYYLDLYWRSMAWKNVTWLGQRVPHPPADLIAYQAIVATARPDFIVETNRRSGGRALFLASVCDLVDHGHIISVSPSSEARLPDHPRITYVDGGPLDDEVMTKVHGMVGDPPNAMLVLGLAGRFGLVHTFDKYADLVPVGSYVIFEETIVNGHPVWPGMGPGPHEAVTQILRSRGDFVQDTDMERFGVSFNPGGFLRRTSRA
jgi:cephalosporin hydroxylase/predicted O-methyltransferase YrrM/glycosyltransferase involved in cell wall biosynthesis